MTAKAAQERKRARQLPFMGGTKAPPCARPFKSVCGVQSTRCEARSALISPRADSTPPHHTAPDTRRGIRFALSRRLLSQARRRARATLNSEALRFPSAPVRVSFLQVAATRAPVETPLQPWPMIPLHCTAIRPDSTPDLAGDSIRPNPRFISRPADAPGRPARRPLRAVTPDSPDPNITSVTWGRSLQTDCTAEVTAAQTAFRSNTRNHQVKHPMDLYRSGAVTPVARKRPTGAPAPPLIGRPSGGFTTAFRMSAHRHASTVPVRRRLPPQTRGHCGLHGGPRRATRRLRRVFRRYASKPVLSRRRSPCPRGRVSPAPFPRVAVRPFRTPFRIHRQEMCGQMRHTLLADRWLFGRPTGGFSPKSAAGGPGMPVPPSVFPPLETPLS